MKKTLAGNKIAIVIGVSGYARPKSSGLSEWRELHTAQDVLALKHTLITRFGFTVTPLVTPQQTSRKAILDSLDKLPSKLKPGDTVYIHFSGHGDDDEERGSESLVPSDWRPRNHPQGDNHITNQELAQRITKIKSQLAGGAFFLSFDCCYSGYIASYTRSGGAVIRGRDRSVPRPARTLPKPSATQPKQVLLDQGSTPLILGNAPSAQGRGFTALYACRYNETAKELESPRAMGALTCSLVEALLALPPGATYRELFERVRTRVVAQVDDQHPEAEGDLDRLVFGEKRLPQPKGVPVRLAGGIPQLLAGRLHGVTEGSLYTIYSQKGELPIAQGRVAQVELLQANLILDSLTPLSPAQKAALVTARAVEVKHSFEPPRFAVDLSPIQTYPTAPALRAALEQVAREKGLLRIAGSNDPAEAILQRTERLPESKRPERPGFALLQVPGEHVLGTLPDDEPGAQPLAARVVAMVERAVRLYTLRNLEASAPPPAQPGLPALGAAVTMRLVPVEVRRMGPGRWAYVQDAPPRSEWIAEEQFFRIEFTNTGERETQIFVLDFKTNGELGVLWPKEGQRPRVLLPGEKRFAADDSGQPALFKVSGKPGTGLLKALALPKGGDNDELDIQAVIQSAQGQSNRAANTHPLGFLFNALNEGKRSPVTLGPSELGVATCEMRIIAKPKAN